jgi:hypothetical protein
VVVFPAAIDAPSLGLMIGFGPVAEKVCAAAWSAPSRETKTVEKRILTGGM